MGLFDSTVPFKDQVYKDLKNKAIKAGALFKDPEFPPSGSSIYFSKPTPTDIVWKRPGELVSNPKFFVDGVSSDDFAQGSIGNCWFVAACACLTEEPKLWKKLVPDYNEQEWNEKNRLSGSYEALDGGHEKDTLVDMTGGVGESLKLADYSKPEQRKDIVPHPPNFQGETSFNERFNKCTH